MGKDTYRATDHIQTELTKSAWGKKSKLSVIFTFFVFNSFFIASVYFRKFKDLCRMFSIYVCLAIMGKFKWQTRRLFFFSMFIFPRVTFYTRSPKRPPTSPVCKQNIESLSFISTVTTLKCLLWWNRFSCNCTIITKKFFAAFPIMAPLAICSF